MSRLLMAGAGGLCLLFSFSHAQELKASADLINQKGEMVGKAELVEVNTGVLVRIEVSGLPPSAELALHIHELGKCDPPDFMSAKGHFNHVLNTFVTLQKGKANSLLKEGGTSLMIHAHKDDYKTDPAGQAGHRIVCGVIK